jgi:trimeric autotransporter adhesin
MSTSSVLDLNNQGVAMLLLHEMEGGSSCKEANALFRQALGVHVASMKAQEYDAYGSSLSSSCSSSSSSSSFDTTTIISPTSSAGNETIMALVEHSFSPGNAFCFYGKPFLLVNKNTSGRCNDTTTTTTTTTMTTTATTTCSCTEARMMHTTSTSTTRIDITVALLFNLGLTSHYMAIRTGQSTYVKRAMHMYRKAFAILTAGGFSHGSSNGISIGDVTTSSTFFDIDTDDFYSGSSAALNVLLLATCNNLGHCSSYLFDYTTTTSCQIHIISILARLEHDQKMKNKRRQEAAATKSSSSSSSSSSTSPSSSSADSSDSYSSYWQKECYCFYSSTVLYVYSGGSKPVVPLAPAA